MAGMRTARMAAELDAAAEVAKKVEGFDHEIYERIQKGKGTGNALVDMVVMRSGVYIPDIVRHYSPVEERMARHLGKPALVVIQWHEHEERRGRRSKARPLLYQGKLTGDRPIVDPGELSWALPVDRYAELAGEPWVPQVKDGPMPVNDLLEFPDRAGYTSTLGQELATKRKSYTAGDPESGYPPVRIFYREFQETTLLLGREEIAEAGFGEQYEELEAVLTSPGIGQ